MSEVTVKPYLCKQNGESFEIPPEDFTVIVSRNTGTVTCTYLKQLEEGDTINWNTFYEVTFDESEE